MTASTAPGSGDGLHLGGHGNLGAAAFLAFVLGFDRKELMAIRSYLLNGQDVSQLSLSKLAEIRNASFGFVMQHFALIEEDNALQNVATPLLFAKARRSQMDARAMEQLRNVGMEQMANKRIATLSGGEKQRVAIARAMVNNPEIILADEPTGALDRANTEKIVQLFQQLNEKGKTIIIVTHDDFVAQSCRRIVTIADGVIKST